MRSKTSPLPPEYDARLSVVVPKPLSDAIATAAHASLQSINSYTRGALIEKLRRDGCALEPQREVA